MQSAISFLKERKGFTFVFILLLTLKTAVGFMTVKNDFGDKLIPVEFSFHKNFAGFINLDDREMAATALHKLNDNKYLIEVVKHRSRTDSLLESAYRPRFNVCLHVAGLKLYMQLTGRTIRSSSEIPYEYYYIFGLSICILKTIVFIISTFFFLSMLLLFFSESWIKAGFLLYIIFPTIFFYIGMFEIFENIAMPVLVIVFSILYCSVNERKNMDFLESIAVAILVSISCLLRPQTLLIFNVLFLFYALLWIFNFFKNKTALLQTQLMFITIAFVIAVHLPILVSNHKTFGSYLLSTQSGMEFFQGHNAYARGSWYHDLLEEHANDFQTIFDEQRSIENCNEKQEMDLYFNAGKEWIVTHPGHELLLIARKTAIYFLPYNYLNRIFNPVNLIMYVGTIGFLLFSFYKRIKRAEINDLLKMAIILTPLAGSYLLTIIFFMGERWRYYAEPFMIIYALIFFNDVYILLGRNKN